MFDNAVSNVQNGLLKLSYKVNVNQHHSCCNGSLPVTMKPSTSKAVKCRKGSLQTSPCCYFKEAKILKPYCVMRLVDALLYSTEFIYKSSVGGDWEVSVSVVIL